VEMSPLRMQRGVRQYVLDCNIRRLTAEETAEYLRQNGLPRNAHIDKTGFHQTIRIQSI